MPTKTQFDGFVVCFHSSISCASKDLHFLLLCGNLTTLETQKHLPLTPKDVNTFVYVQRITFVQQSLQQYLPLCRNIREAYGNRETIPLPFARTHIPSIKRNSSVSWPVIVEKVHLFRAFRLHLIVLPFTHTSKGNFARTHTREKSRSFQPFGGSANRRSRISAHLSTLKFKGFFLFLNPGETI